MRKQRTTQATERLSNHDLFDFAKKNDLPVRAQPSPQAAEATAQVAVPVIREKRDRPFIDSDGGLVIPFESDNRYHWWAGGQSVEETLKEITGHDDSRAGVDIRK